MVTPRRSYGCSTGKSLSDDHTGSGLGDKLKTDLPVTLERIGHAAESPAVFFRHRGDCRTSLQRPQEDRIRIPNSKDHSN
jgi:hypothetical protein